MRLVACVLVGILPLAAAAEQYVFSQGDILTIRAGRWNHVAGQFEYWAGVSGDYQVAPDGTIFVPLAGPTGVVGLTAPELSAILSQEMQRRIGVTSPPEVAIEVASQAPIYLTGAVANAGEHAYRYGMTLQQALALGGGFRTAETPIDGTERELIRIDGQVRVFESQLESLRREAARLEAELTVLESVTGNEVRVDGVDGVDLGEVETGILNARQRAIEAQGENIRELQVVVAEQIQRLDEQIGLRQTQLAAARDELRSVEQLKEQGLAVRSRETAMLSAVSDLQAQLIQLEVARLQAEQQLNLARRDETTLYDESWLRRLAELREVRADITVAETQLNTARALRVEALARGGYAGTSLTAPLVSYMITRFEDGTASVFEADLQTVLSPGDTVEVIVRTDDLLTESN